MKSSESKKIPGWIKRARQIMTAQGLSNSDLTDALSVSTPGAVSHYLNGRRELSAHQAVALAERLGCSLDWLLTGKMPELESLKSRGKQALSVDDVSELLQGLHPDIYEAISGLIMKLSKINQGNQGNRIKKN